MSRPWFLVVALLAVLGVIAAACGNDDDAGSAGEATDTGAGETTSEDAASEEDAGTDEEAAPAETTDLGVDTLEVMTRWVDGTAEAEAFAVAVEAFTERTGVNVDIVGEGTEDLDVAYETALLGNQEPHLVIINLFDKSIAWIDNEAVVDVAAYIDEWGLADVVNPLTVQEWTRDDGRVQGFPYSGFAWPVWYNTELLAQAGVDSIPTTTEELKAAAAALDEAGIEPVVVGGSDWSGQKLFMQIAQSYIDRDTIISLLNGGGWCANPDALAGIELFNELLEAGVFIDDVEGYTADLMNETFYTGDAAIMPAGSWAFDGTPPDLLPSVQLGGFPLPDGSTFANPTVYQGFTGVGFMLSPRGESDALPAVRELVTQLYDEEFYGNFVAANIVPTIQLEDTSVASNPLLQTALGTDYDNSTDVAVLMDVHVAPQAQDGVNQAIALAYTGADADEVCSRLDGAY